MWSHRRQCDCVQSRAVCALHVPSRNFELAPCDLAAPSRRLLPQLNLTAKTIDGLRLAEDGQVEYLGCRAEGIRCARVQDRAPRDSETKTFFVRYRVGKKMRRLTIGDVDRVHAG